MRDEQEFVFAPTHVTVVHEEDDELVEESLTPACDFCLDTRVEWEYPCADFTIDELSFGSQGEWLACGECAKYIEARYLPLLTLRTARSAHFRGEPMEGEKIMTYGRIQQGFFDHQTGQRVPYVP